MKYKSIFFSQDYLFTTTNEFAIDLIETYFALHMNQPKKIGNYLY